MYGIALLLFLLCLPSVCPALTPEEEYKKIQEQMLEQKKKLRETQERESSVLTEIDTMNINLGRIEAELIKYRKSLNQTNSEVSAVNSEISKTAHSLQRQRDWIKRKLRMMHRFGYSGDMAMLLLSSSDISQMRRFWKYLENIALYEHKILGDYRENLRRLDEKYARLQSLQVSLRENTEKVKTKEAELAEKKKAKEIILSSVRTEKSAHQKMISELREASKRLQDLIRDSSKTDTYTATGFPGLKGRLPWPAEGKIAVPYGTQKDAQFSTPVFRNGIHIQTDPHADARAVYEGKVIYAEWFKGFGQLVIVNHGSGYHTLYGNLSEIFSHVGDIIKANQVMGKVGTSGILNAPGLYFEIRYKGKPLDPTQWLKNRRK
ncbi:MAG: peptidoglycan DD-metalloendopeptidase family protein [Nitrospirae bacterium]|nr:peptidoglycan DD-metalloendopeptidase family protein [Nitrospirota bacterium]